MINDCPFCEIDRPTVRKTDLWTVFYDGFPVTSFHMLLVPNRHVETFFDLSENEYQDLLPLLISLKDEYQGFDKTITGWNIGVNCGTSAGQTIMHCHIHLIPRRNGDVEDPRGGIRHVIPGKGNYLR